MNRIMYTTRDKVYFFLRMQETFMKTNHILGYKANKFPRITIIQIMLSDYSAIRSKISNRKITEGKTSMKILTLVLISNNNEKLESWKCSMIWVWLSKLCHINTMGYHVAIKNYFFKCIMFKV